MFSWLKNLVRKPCDLPTAEMRITQASGTWVDEKEQEAVRVIAGSESTAAFVKVLQRLNAVAGRQGIGASNIEIAITANFNRRHLPTLHDALKHSNDVLRFWLLKLLQKCGDESSIMPVLELWGAGDYGILGDQALREWGNQASSTSRALAEGHPDEFLRILARLRALAPQKRTPLWEVLNNAEQTFRGSAILEKLLQPESTGPASNPAASAMAPEQFEELCKKGTVLEIKAAIAAGADVHARTMHGGTALMSATANPDPGAVAALVAAGADVNARTSKGQTALMIAAMECTTTAMIEALIKAGAKPNLENRYGWTALKWAAQVNPNTEIHRALIEGGADVTISGLLEVCESSNRNKEAVLAVLQAAGAR